MNRRGIGRWAIFLLSLGLLGLSKAPPRPRPMPAVSPASDAERAVRAYRAMQQYFFIPASYLYRERYPPSDGDGYTTLWPFSQALVATLDLSELPAGGARFTTDVRDRLSGLSLFWDPRSLPSALRGLPVVPGYTSTVVAPFGFAGDLYYDDNCWVALALLQHYYLSEDQSALNRAEQIFQLLVSGWDTNPAHPFPGGVFWTQAIGNHDRNVVSTAPAAELGVHLYTLTHDPAYLRWATRMYSWVNRSLRASDGLYWDHIDLAGRITPDLWSYNQGTMLGAAVLLHQATGDPAYLEQAQQIADAALTYFGSGDGFSTQPAAFNAIFFRNLLRLAAVRPDARYRAALQTYSRLLWQQVDPSTGLLRPQPSEPATLLDQAALVQVSALLAQGP